MMIGFNFNNEKFDFWAVYKTILQYYPIGIENEYPGPFFEYEGIKKLEEIVVTRIHDDKNFHDEWETYWDSVSIEINRPIIGTTYGQAPSFSSYILINEDKGKLCDYFEELHFSVSLIGPFYTIIGQSRTVITTKQEMKGFEAVNRITSSPTQETKQYFDLLASKIESKYKGYKFVPYSINEQFLQGLRVRYSDRKENRIYNALFNDNIRFEAVNVGDPYFRIKEWER